MLGFAFSNEMEVVHYVAKIVPVLCLSFMVDGFLGVLCGKLSTLNLINEKNMVKKNSTKGGQKFFIGY